MSLGKKLLPQNTLQQLLEVWKSSMQFSEAVATVKAECNGDMIAQFSLTGAMKNWRDLTKDLTSRKPLDKDKYFIPPYVLNKYFDSSPSFIFIPEILSMWTRCSMHMYMTSKDLQGLLELTRIGKVRWSDIRPPFNSFGMVLPIPISWKMDGKKQPDINFVYVQFDAGQVFIVIPCQDLVHRLYLTEKKSAEINEALKAKNYAKLNELLGGLNDKYFQSPLIQTIKMDLNDEKSIMEDIEEDFETVSTVDGNYEVRHEGLGDHLKLIVRIVVGLCLHMEDAIKNKKAPPMIKSGSWNRISHEVVDGDMITAASQICMVESVSPMTDAERKVHSLLREHGTTGKYSLPYGFRSSTWRRKRGTGGDPNAPRCEFVRHSIINKHKMFGPGLPKASMVLVGK